MGKRVYVGLRFQTYKSPSWRGSDGQSQWNNKPGAPILHCKSKAERKLEIVWAFKLSKPNSNNTIPLTRPHFPKQFYQLETITQMPDCEGHFPFKPSQLCLGNRAEINCISFRKIRSLCKSALSFCMFAPQGYNFWLLHCVQYSGCLILSFPL